MEKIIKMFKDLGYELQKAINKQLKEWGKE